METEDQDKDIAAAEGEPKAEDIENMPPESGQEPGAGGESPEGGDESQGQGDAPEAEGDGEEQDKDEKGVPWKNRAMEAQRKLDAAQARLESIESRPTEPAADQRRQEQPGARSTILEAQKSKLLAKGYAPAAVDAILDTVDAVLSERLQPFGTFVQSGLQERREAETRKLAADKESGPVAKAYMQELNKELDSISDPALRANPQVQNAALWRVVGMNPGKFKDLMRSGKTVLEESSTETKPGGKAPRSGGVPIQSDELQEFMDNSGIDDPVVARKALAAQKKGEAAQRKT